MNSKTNYSKYNDLYRYKKEGKKVNLAYWSLRSQAQISRYALEVSGVPYEETRYKLEEKDKWFQIDKPAQKHPIAAFPLLTDGDI